jgi:hypothetical protein
VVERNLLRRTVIGVAACRSLDVIAIAADENVSSNPSGAAYLLKSLPGEFGVLSRLILLLNRIFTNWLRLGNDLVTWP